MAFRRHNGHAFSISLQRDCNGSISWDKISKFESYLDEQERVSLVFLLCDDSNVAIDIILRHAIKSINGTTGSKIQKGMFKEINKWARTQNVHNFEKKLIEALCLVQNFRILEKLGYEKSNPEIKSFTNCELDDSHHEVHRMRKMLFYMCESMILPELDELIRLVKLDFTKAESHFLNDYSSDLMELNILSWVSQGYINDGVKNTCDVGAIVSHLRSLQREEFAKKLEIVEKQCNEEFNLEHDRMFCDNNPSCYNMTCNDGSDREMYDSKIDPKECYALDPHNMGICIIINQKHFNLETNSENNMSGMCGSGAAPRTSTMMQVLTYDQKLETRDGTDVDRDWLNITFSGFGYKVVILEDLDHFQFEKEIRQITQQQLESTHSSLVLCILSHGIKGAVYCSDNVPVAVERIKTWILGVECPKLLGKPKVLIIQACQGKKRQIAMVLDVDPNDLVVDGKDSIRCPPTADLITFWATLPGFTSIRNARQGSWFIQSLCKQLLQQGHKAHLKDIFTSVNLEVSQKYASGNEVMMSTSEDTIRKKMHFPFLPELRQLTAKSMLERYLFDYLLSLYQARTKAFLEYKMSRNAH